MSQFNYSEEFDFENRIVDTQETPEDIFDGDNPLRPKSFDDYVGQEKVKENLKVFIEAAKKRGEVLDHVLLYGPPDLVKLLFLQLLPTSLVLTSALPQALQLKSPVI